MAAIRIALLTLRLVMRTKAALFFTFLFPLIFLFVYAGLFARGNPEAVAYLFGPVVTLNIMGSGFWGLGLQSVMQRERGSLRRYRLAPIGSATIVTSNLLANYLLQLPTIGLLFFCAVVFFHMPMKIGWLTLFVLVTVGAFAFAGFGLTIASLANTMQEAQIYNNLVWLTLLFLSGVTIPLALLPHWIQRLATFLPATYLVSAFQSIMLQSQPLAAHWPEMLALTVSGVFGVLFAWKLFRWEKEERIPRSSKLWSITFLVPFVLIGLWMNTYANPIASWAMTYYLMGRGTGAGSETANSSPENLIESFESPNASEELMQLWQVSAGAASPAHSVAYLSLVSPGAAGTQHAMRFEGRLGLALPDRASASSRYKLRLPASAKDLRGIAFWVRGDSRVYQISVLPGGSSSGLHPQISLAPSREWQSVRLPVEWAADSSKAPSWVLEIAALGAPGEFSFEIDEIMFY